MGHIEGGHKILYGDPVARPTQVVVQDSCPFRLPEMWTIAHASNLVWNHVWLQEGTGSHPKLQKTLDLGTADVSAI